MEARELRIGNWITVMGSLPCQVTASHLYMMETYEPVEPDAEADYKEMTEPIPLTEEWLVKLGFEARTENAGNLPCFKKGRITIARWGEKKWQLWIDTIDWKNSPQHIHELQNFWYQYFGSDLTIKGE